MPILKQNTELTMFKNTVILVIVLAASVCHAFTEISWWTIPAGKDRVIEFLSEDIKLYCHGGCQAYTVAGKPDEIYVLSMRKDILTALLRGEVIKGPFQKVYVLNLKSRALTLMELDRFLKLDIIFEDFPVRRYQKHPEIEYGGNPDGHNYVAPIQRNGKEFIATLSSARKTSEKTTFGIPGIIPFFGRSEWFQKEESHKGTFFLEIFDTEHPSKPIVQLQKKFKDLWLLPSIFEMASWTQGTKEPVLVVVDHENPIKERRGRILVFRL
jgi:hypothetical protein